MRIYCRTFPFPFSVLQHNFFLRGFSVENKVNNIAKIWQKKRFLFLFFLTCLVLILLGVTATKLVAYGIWRPVAVNRVENTAFDMVMVYRKGIREEKRDEYLKCVNKAPHIFLRAAGISPGKNASGRKNEK